MAGWEQSEWRRATTLGNTILLTKSEWGRWNAWAYGDASSWGKGYSTRRDALAYADALAAKLGGWPL